MAAAGGARTHLGVDGTVRRAELTDTDRVPLVRLWFNRHNTLKGGRRLLDAVRALPRAQFDGEAQCWVVSATGRDPDRLLQRWGFEIDLEAEDPSLAGVQSLGEVFDPLLRLSAKQPGVVLVRPRLAGFARTLELLGPGRGQGHATVRGAGGGPGRRRRRGELLESEPWRLSARTLPPGMPACGGR